MQWAGKRRRGRRRAQVRIGLRAAHGAHGTCGAVLLMIGVQDEQDVQRPGDDRVHLELRLHHPPEHVHEVLGVAEFVIRIDVRIAVVMPEGKRGNRGHLGDQADDLHAPRFDVVHLSRFGVDGGQSRQRAHQHGHGMGVIAEAIHEFLGVFVQQHVRVDFLGPAVQLNLGGQLTVMQKVGDFQIGTLLGQHFDRIAAIAQDSLVAIDKRDGALAGGRVHVGRIVRHQAEVFRTRFDLSQIHGPDGIFEQRNRVGAVRSIVSDRECVIRHRSPS